MQYLGTHPRLAVDPDGHFRLSEGLPDVVLRERFGETVKIEIDGIRFAVHIGSSIRIPVQCASISEAKYLATSICYQIVLGSRALADDTSYADRALDEPLQVTVVADCDPKAAQQPGTLDGLFLLWANHHIASGGAPTTIPYWRTLFKRFEGHLGHDQPGRVTAADVRAYRDHLISEKRNLKTLRNSDLAAIRTIFAFAVENHILESNPAASVRVREARLGGAKRMRAFSDDEASQVLAAADRETRPYRRWIPWLTALTGSRVSTMIDLRRQDVRQYNGIWCIRVTLEAGPVKTGASERIVPIHRAILDRGFIDFALGGDRDYLFVDNTRDGFIRDGKVVLDQDLRPYYPGRSVANRLTEWVHSLGIDVGRSVGKDPNHAWRHWFKEKGFSAGIEEKVIDAIVGHAQINASRRYGEVSVEVMAEALDRITSPLV